MKTRISPVQPILVELLCNKCESVMENRSNEMILASYPPKYLHVCKKCGHSQLTSEAFPQLKYEYIGEPPSYLSESKNPLDNDRETEN